MKSEASKRVSRPPSSSVPRWTAADHVAVVVNGNAKHVTQDLVQSLDQIVKGGDLFVSRSLEEGNEIARTIVERGYRTVLTGGGDGTFVQMVSRIVFEADQLGREVPRFGLLKLGTGNALAWVLGAQDPRRRGVVADLARLRTEGGSRRLRLIETEGMLTPFAGLGADAITIKHYSETRRAFLKSPVLKYLASGPIVYSAAIAGRTVPQFLFGNMPTVRITNQGEPAFRLGDDGQPTGRPIEAGEVIYDGTVTLLAFSTIPYWGFGARIFPFAEEREDRFNLRIVSFGSVEAMRYLKQIWQGTHRSARLRDVLAQNIRIECDRPTPFQVGGDVIGLRDRVDARLSDRDIHVVDYYAPPPV